MYTGAIFSVHNYTNKNETEKIYLRKKLQQSVLYVTLVTTGVVVRDEGGEETDRVSILFSTSVIGVVVVVVVGV